jgi:hypothetical protein
MPDSAWAPPLQLTMITYRNIFAVVFPTSGGKARDGAAINLDG